MLQPNVLKALRALGNEFDTRRELYGLLFDEAKLRESVGFWDLWSFDFPLDQLSGRQRIARFSWIKRPE
jgi:hypothetical protein